MNPHAACDHPCDHPCTEAEAAPVPLAEAVARFDREAQRGVCDTGRYRLPYFVWGTGPPLVFVHGVSDSSRSFVPLIARLSGQFRCVAYDLPGVPGDGSRLWRYRHEHLTDDLLALLDHLTLDRAYLLAASFGATVALRVASREPRRFPRVVLQAGTAYRPLRRREYWLSWLGRLVPGSVAGIPKREKILEKVHRHAFTESAQDEWRAFVEWTAGARLATLSHQAQWLHRVDLRPELPHVTQPVLLVWGDRDFVMPLAHADALMAGLPSAGMAVIEGAGHVPCYSHPDALAAVVRKFLTPPKPCPGPEACAADGRRPLPCVS